MKKLFGLLSACLLSLCLLVSCGSKIGAVKKAFEKAEYKITEQTIDDEKSVVKSIAAVNKGLNAGFVIELGSTDDIDEALKELKKDPVYDAYLKKYGSDINKIKEGLEEAGLVNGNCMFIGTPDAVAIFKEA